MSKPTHDPRAVPTSLYGSSTAGRGRLETLAAHQAATPHRSQDMSQIQSFSRKAYNQIVGAVAIGVFLGGVLTVLVAVVLSVLLGNATY